MKLTNSISKNLFAVLVLTVFIGKLTISTSYAQESETTLPEHKQTTLGLYVTSAEAYTMWLAYPEAITVLDVRTPEEYIYIGHAPMAYNVPIALQSYSWNATTNEYDMKMQSDFVTQVQSIAEPTDTILVTCRSGSRSAMAVNQLAAAGYLYVFNITDGFEGDMVKDEASLYYEKRMVNGWKNSGIPWTYELDQNLVILPNNNLN